MKSNIQEILRTIAELSLHATDPQPRSRRQFFAGSGALALKEVLVCERFWEMDPKMIFQDMAMLKYGVLCGAAAWLLMKKYEELGYSSWTYHCGSPPESHITHVVTLVQNEKKEFYLQDATVGLSIFLGDMGSDWREAIYTKYLFLPVRKQLLIPVDALDQISDHAFLMPPREHRKESCFKKVRSGVSLYTEGWCGPKVFNRHPWWPEAELFLAKKGLKPVPLTLFLLPMALYSSQDGYVTNPLANSETSHLLKKFHL